METYSTLKSTNKINNQSIGFRLDDVKKYFPEAYAQSGKKEGIIYDQFAVLAIQGIKELMEENSKLRDELKNQKNEVEALKSEMSAYMVVVDKALRELSGNK